MKRVGRVNGFHLKAQHQNHRVVPNYLEAHVTGLQVQNDFDPQHHHVLVTQLIRSLHFQARLLRLQNPNPTQAHLNLRKQFGFQEAQTLLENSLIEVSLHP